MLNIGDKVGLIFSETDTEIRWLGYATYTGNSIPNDGIGILSEMYKRNQLETPKFQLDGSSQYSLHVYGTECYWYPSDKAAEILDKEDRYIRHLRISRSGGGFLIILDS